MFSMKLMLFAVLTILGIDMAFAITGAQNVTRGQFPFYVELELFKDVKINFWQNKKPHHTCGGSLIAPQWVLTAGQCLENADHAKVYLGLLSMANAEEAGRQIINVTNENFFIYPSFKRSSSQNDIALVKLPEAIQCSEYIHTILLTTSSTATIPSGIETITVGYSRTNVVQYAKLKTVDLLDCVTDTQGLISKNSVICAKGDTITPGGEDAGNPLILDNQLIGIASTTTKFVKGATQGFAGIAAYTEWIAGVKEGVIGIK